MSPSLRKFLGYSAVLHLVFFFAAGLLIIQAEPAPEMVQVRLLGSALLMEQSLDSGQIMDIHPPLRESVPEQADVLSQWDSTAHGPGKGKKYSSTRQAIPRETVNPPAPSRDRSKFEIVPVSPDPPALNVAALQPEIRKESPAQAHAVNVFSEDDVRAKADDSATRYTQKGPRQNVEKHTTVSSLITDNPGKPREDQERAAGLEKAKGADLSDFAASATGVLDMGDEAVVSFNTRRFEYAEYFGSIRKAVDRVWEYPEEAVVGGWSGVVKVVFTVRRDGRLLEVKVLQSAGKKELDDSAQAALTAAGPFPPFPPGLEKQRIHVVAEFRYQPSFHALQ